MIDDEGQGHGVAVALVVVHTLIVDLVEEILYPVGGEVIGLAQVSQVPWEDYGVVVHILDP